MLLCSQKQFLKKFFRLDIVRQIIVYMYDILSVADENSLSYTYVNKHPELSLIYVLIILSPIEKSSGFPRSFFPFEEFYCIR